MEYLMFWVNWNNDCNDFTGKLTKMFHKPKYKCSESIKEKWYIQIVLGHICIDLCFTLEHVADISQALACSTQKKDQEKSINSPIKHYRLHLEYMLNKHSLRN